MNEQAHIDSEALIAEIARYLAVVDTFRAADCEPTWRPELRPDGDAIVLRLADYGQTAAAAGS